MNSLMTPMKKIYTAAFLFLSSTVAFAQSSPVVLSGLKVTPVIDAAAEKNSLMIEMNVSDPSALTRLEVSTDDGNAEGAVTNLYAVTQKGNVVELVFDKYAVPFEGQTIRFFLKVKDQMKSPYHKVMIKAYDKSNKATNSLVYDQIN
jgi:hypothetical protein